MNNRLHNRAEAGYRRPRSLASLAASLALLAVLLGSQGPGMVQAAPPASPADSAPTTTFKLYAEQQKERPGYACIGEDIKFRVTVVKETYDASTGKTTKSPLSFITVTTTVVQKNLLTITSHNPLKIRASGTGWPSANFQYKGTAAGTATIYFEAMLPKGYLSGIDTSGLSDAQKRALLYASNQTQVDIIQCPLQFALLDFYEVVTEGFRTDMVATVEWTTLEQADTEGKLFTAHPMKSIVLRQFGGPCRYSLATAQRQVDIKAEKIDNPEWDYKISYTQGETVFKYTTVCPEGVGNIFTEFPDPPGTDFYATSFFGDSIRDIPVAGGIKMTSVAVVRAYIP